MTPAASAPDAHPGWRDDAATMLRGAWPLILINLAITGMQFVDAVMVAPLGPAALAAVFPAAMIFLTLVVFGHGVLSLVNTFVAQSRGAGDRRLCGAYAVQGLWFSLALGLLVAAQIPFAPFWFRWFGHEPEVFRMEVDYFQWCAPGAMAHLAVVALSSFFTGLLRTRFLVVASFLATGANVFFNWIFIYGHWGAPAMGVAGAALGTSLAAGVQALVLLARFWWPDLRAAFGTGRLALDRQLFSQLLRFGAPAGALPVFDLITWGVLLTWIIGWFGTSHLAANTVVVRYLHLTFMPGFAIGSVLTSMVGAEIGAGQPRRARWHARFAYLMVGSYMVAVGLLFALFREPMMRLFSGDPEVVRAGGWMLVCAAIFQVTDAMYLTFSAALRGAGDTIWPSAVMVLSGTLVLVGGAYGLARFFPELTSLGPWIALVAHSAVIGGSMALRWSFGRWEKRGRLL